MPARTRASARNEGAGAAAVEPMPWRSAGLLGLGSLAVGASSPLYDSYVPRLLEQVLASSAAVGAMMGLDNVLGLALIPLFGSLSDRTQSRLGRRVPFVLAGLPLAALALAAVPSAAARGFAALAVVLVLYQLATLATRAPFQALLCDLVPAIHRTRAYGMMSVLMCVGAMGVLASAMQLYPVDPRLPFLLAGGLILLVAAVFARWLREPAALQESPAAASIESAEAPRPASIRSALRSIRAERPVLAFFAGCLAYHVGFQTLSSWFTTYGEERFRRPVNECSSGFIVLAIATLLASYPAGVLGARWGRRMTALVGIAGMAAASLLLHGAATLEEARVLLFGFGVAWALPAVNLFPMALELARRNAAGTFAGLFFTCQCAAGLLGPAAAGAVFDGVGSKRPLFLVIACALSLACALLAALPRGTGEVRPGRSAGA